MDRDVLGNKKRENVLKGKNYFVGTDALQKMYRRKVCSRAQVLWVVRNFRMSPKYWSANDQSFQGAAMLRSSLPMQHRANAILASPCNFSAVPGYFFPQMHGALFGDVTTETINIVTLVVRSAVLS